MMRDEITEELSEAFNSDLADAVSQFNGVRVVKGDYNAITGESNDQVINYSGRGVFAGFAINLVDGESILSMDQQVIALQAEVSDTPQINDSINGYKVINVGHDPANAIWIIHLR